MFAGQTKVQNVYFRISIYCSRASQNNLTGAIVPELVFIPNAAPRRKKLLILFDHYKRLASVLTLIWQANLVRRCPLLILYRDGNFSAVKQSKLSDHKYCIYGAICFHSL